MKKDRIFVNVITTIAVFLVVMLVIYFVFTENAFDGSWKHTYFLGSVLIFCVLGLIGFFVQKRKLRNSLLKKKKKIGELSFIPKNRVYIRPSGETFLRLNEKYHVKTVKVGDNWFGDGQGEEIDPEEEVEVVIQ